jgi:hypothetical protein
MTIPALFDLAVRAIILLSITAFSLAFVFIYASESKKNQGK